MSTRRTILETLKSKLLAGTSANAVERKIDFPDDYEGRTPYIGIVRATSAKGVQDATDQRVNFVVELELTVNRMDDGLNHVEDFIEEIYAVIDDPIDLGSDVYRVEITAEDTSQIVSYENEESANVFLNIIFRRSKSTVISIPPFTPTQIEDTALYKEYALLDSGSITIQPLGTNVYYDHNKAAIDIPVGSGSITVGINGRSLEDGGWGNDELLDNNFVECSVRTHFAYGDDGAIDHPTELKITSLVIDRIRKNIDLGDSYRLDTSIDAFAAIYGQFFSESNTRGSQFNFRLNVPELYTQE